MPARCPARHVAGKVSQGIANSFRRQVDRLPVGIVEVRLCPERLVGGRVDGRSAYGELPWAIRWDNRLAQRDVRRPLSRIILNLGKCGEHKACEQGEQTAEAIHATPNFSGGNLCKSI